MDLITALQRAERTIAKGRLEIFEKFPVDFQAIATAEFMEEGKRPRGSKSSKLYEKTGALVRSLLKGQPYNIFEVQNGRLNYGTEVQSAKGFLYGAHWETHDKPFFEPSLRYYRDKVLPKRLEELLEKVIKEFENG